MEYVFGTKGDIEILKTKGEKHTNLKGFHTITREYPDQIIEDRFRVVRKLDSKEDIEENCYDWYEIDRHYRFTDRTGHIVTKEQEDFDMLTECILEMSEIVYGE